MAHCNGASEAMTSTLPYDEFIRRKLATVPPSGIVNAYDTQLHPRLFGHQALLVRWALRRGKAAIFAGTGLGKTGVQTVWSEQVRQHLYRTRLAPARVLIVAPLAVAAQTVQEAERFGVTVRYMRKPEAMPESGIVITNYEMLQHFDMREFGGVAYDESSIIKNQDGKTRKLVIQSAASVLFRLPCTATPAPNDLTELGNHAELLGICSMGDMLATYFVNDGDAAKKKRGKAAGSRGTKWRLKGHARERFWRWVCSWGALVRKPSDLGFSDEGYNLPPLTYHEHIVAADANAARDQGRLPGMAEAAKTLNEQRKARRATVKERVALTADIVASKPDVPWVIWCGLNDESAALAKAIPGSTELVGSMSVEEKERILGGFATGDVTKLITKASMSGFGMNWQHCRDTVVYPSHSWEEWHQLLARFWRFGQTQEVNAHLVVSALEGEVLANVKRKEAEAKAMAEELSTLTREYVRDETSEAKREHTDYNPKQRVVLPAWLGA